MSETIRQATVDDVQAIHALVSAHAGENRLLPRTLASIRHSIDGWLVAVSGESGGVIGCGALASYGGGLCEVRSLVVDTSHQSNGLGGRIVGGLLDMAAERRVKTVFTLTTAVGFFEKQGFTVTTRRNFPLKIYRDCLRCPVKFRCDEMAMVYTNGDV